MKKMLVLGLIVGLFSMAQASEVYKSITIRCSLVEGDLTSVQTKEVISPYGGGKTVTFKKKNGSAIEVTVRTSVNEDDRELIDLSMMIDSSDSKSAQQVTARGLSENKYKENGVTSTVFNDKNGALQDSVLIKCAL